jgi:hypothetical protein
MWDAHDADAGVFFHVCPHEAAVDALAREMTEDNPNERLLTVYDLQRPLEEQGAGLTRGEWLAGPPARDP